MDFKPVVSKSSTSGVLKKVNIESVTHTTIITNHKSTPVTYFFDCINFQVEVVVFDQLPFSSDSNIKVKVEEPANYKVQTGLKSHCEVVGKCTSR